MQPLTEVLGAAIRHELCGRLRDKHLLRVRSTQTSATGRKLVIETNLASLMLTVNDELGFLQSLLGDHCRAIHAELEEELLDLFGSRAPDQ